MAVIGVFYVIFGCIGILLNVLVAYMIHADKTMQNATYVFMTHLALSDIEALVGFVVGPGARIIAGEAPDFLNKLFCYLNFSGIKVSEFFMTLITCSRWLCFAKPAIFKSFFTPRRHLIIASFCWLFNHLVRTQFLYTTLVNPIPNEGGCVFVNNTYGVATLTFEGTTNYLTWILQIVFNVMSIFWIFKMRSQIFSPELRKRHNQEVKLFIQCALDSIVFVFMILLHQICQYAVVCGENMAILFQVLVILNHVDCPIFYLCFNNKLRSNIVVLIKKIFYSLMTTTPTPVVNVNY